MTSTITVVRGDSQELTLTLTDSAGAPYDLTDADVRMTVLDLFEKSLSAGSIVVDDPPSGVAEITVDPADTSGLPSCRTVHPYDVQIVTSDDLTKTPVRGRFVVLPDVTI